jgi:hypothetical protein
MGMKSVKGGVQEYQSGSYCEDMLLIPSYKGGCGISAADGFDNRFQIDTPSYIDFWVHLRVWI